MPQATPCAQLRQCHLTCRFGLTGQVPCSCIRMVAHCHGLIWWQQCIKPWLQMALMCHVSMAIFFGLEPLLLQPRLAFHSVSGSLEVVRIHDLCSYLAPAADSYLPSPSVFMTVLCFCMFVCFILSCIGCFLVVSCFI